MSIPTEPIGGIPRPPALQTAVAEHAEGRLTEAELTTLQEQATAGTLARLEQLGCAVLVDGEQAKPSFAGEWKMVAPGVPSASPSKSTR